MNSCAQKSKTPTSIRRGIKNITHGLPKTLRRGVIATHRICVLCAKDAVTLEYALSASPIQLILDAFAISAMLIKNNTANAIVKFLDTIKTD